MKLIEGSQLFILFISLMTKRCTKQFLTFWVCRLFHTLSDIPRGLTLVVTSFQVYMRELNAGNSFLRISWSSLGYPFIRHLAALQTPT